MLDNIKDESWKKKGINVSLKNLINLIYQTYKEKQIRNQTKSLHTWVTSTTVGTKNTAIWGDGFLKRCE